MSTVQLLKTIGRYPALVYSEARADGIFLKAAALAFVSILSLVPLLAVFSFVGQGLFNQYQERILESLSHVLPYQEESLIRELNRFLQQARALQGAGLLWFLIVSLFVFGTIESTLSTIWDVSGQRPLRERILSFTLLLFWGPILIGATLTSLVFVRELPWFAPLVERFPLVQLAPFSVNLLGLTVLYWLVPYAPVRFRSAATGGIVAAALLEILRQGFGLYVQQVSEQVNVIYGGFSLALFFMISIEMSWIIVLLGCELAYVTQHFQTLVRIRGRSNPPHRLWVGLASLCLIAARFYQREPITSREILAAQLGIPPDALRPILAPLVQDNLLREEGRDGHGYLLAGDPRGLRVDQIFKLYDGASEEMLGALPGEFGGALQGLRSQILSTNLETVGSLTLANLVKSLSLEGTQENTGAPALGRRQRTDEELA